MTCEPSYDPRSVTDYGSDYGSWDPSGVLDAMQKCNDLRKRYNGPLIKDQFAINCDMFYHNWAGYWYFCEEGAKLKTTERCCNDLGPPRPEDLRKDGTRRPCTSRKDTLYKRGKCLSSQIFF